MFALSAPISNLSMHNPNRPGFQSIETSLIAKKATLPPAKVEKFPQDIVELHSFQDIDLMQESNLKREINSPSFSLSHFTKRILECLEIQQEKPQAYNGLGIDDKINVGFGQNNKVTSATNNGIDIVVTPSDGKYNVELSLENGNIIRINGISSNVRFTPDESGRMIMVTDIATTTFDANGKIISTEDGGNPLIGTDSNDIIVNFDGAIVSGNEGDDLVINYSPDAEIAGGEGNDNIIIANAIASKIKVDLGDGDDSLTIEDIHAETDVCIYGGEGDDKITIGAVKGSSTNLNIDTGNGNNHVSIKHAVVGSAKINGGSSNDKISIGTLLTARTDHSIVISTGSGDNEISANSIHGVAINSNNGNDIIDIGFASNSIIDGGEGNNKITVGTMYKSLLINGGGDDVISIDAMLSSMILSKKLETSLFSQSEHEDTIDSLNSELSNISHADQLSESTEIRPKPSFGEMLDLSINIGSIRY